MAGPLFSIIIPTRRRADRAAGAIKSALSQTEPSFEVVVIDNDDSDETSDLCRSFDDSRLRYVRTGNLSMPENWSVGLRASRGEYTLVLADRNVLRSWTLQTLKRVIRQVEGKLFVWSADGFARDPKAEVFQRIDFSASVSRFTTDEVLDLMLTGRPDQWSQAFPRLLNSCVRRDVLDAVIERTGGRPCQPLAPDYTGGLHQLLISGEIVHVDVPLYVACGRGNGTAFRAGTGREYLDTLGLSVSEIYRDAILTIASNHNIVLRDVLSTCLAHGRVDVTERLDRKVFFREVCRDLYQRSRTTPIPLSDLAKLMAAVFRQKPEVIRSLLKLRDFWFLLTPPLPKKQLIREKLSSLRHTLQTKQAVGPQLRFPGLDRLQAMAAEQALPRPRATRADVSVRFSPGFRDAWNRAPVLMDLTDSLFWGGAKDYPNSALRSGVSS